MENDLFLSADDAAAQLGVSIPTLYAYVSRKMIRSEQIEGSRKRRYWKADIDRISGVHAGPRAVEAPAHLAIESSITLITERGLFFRGQDAIALSAHASLESVAALLWQADDEALFGETSPRPTEFLKAVTSLQTMTSSERAIALLPMLERSNPKSYDLSPRGFVRTASDALRWYAAIIGNQKKAAEEPLHIFLAKSVNAPAGFDDIIRRLLVLSADHEFDPVTYAVRAVANVGVTAYQAITTGLIASTGQRFMAERYGAAVRMLGEILSSDDGSAPILQRFKNGESLPGFTGNAEQPDPRTVAIMAALEQALHSDAQFKKLSRAQAAAAEIAGKPLAFIMPAIFVGHFLGMRGEELGITSVGRIVGWLAHAMEQFHGSELVRPRSAYVGLLPKAGSL
ncbi:MAG: citrate synthase [Pseudomonadota bacterium]